MLSCSIIIPTLNAGHMLEPLVTSLNKQSVIPLEIIIIDSSSTDATQNNALRLGCTLMAIPRSEFNHGGTRNLPAAKAKGEALVFLTQDALPANPRFLEELLKPLERGIAASYARQIPYPSARPTERFARAFNYPRQSTLKTKADLDSLGIRTYFFSNVASAIRKDVFLETGMFPDNVIMNEDMLFCSKLIDNGHAVMYTSESEVYHSHNYTLKQTFQRYFDIGSFYEKNFKKNNNLKTNSSGAYYTKNIIIFLLNNNFYTAIPFCIMEIFAKFLGFYSGKMGRFIPICFKRKLSLHKFYWE